MANINNNVGSKSLAQKDKAISREDCDSICHMIRLMCLKVEESNVDTNTEAPGLQVSFVKEDDILKREARRDGRELGCY